MISCLITIVAKGRGLAMIQLLLQGGGGDVFCHQLWLLILLVLAQSCQFTEVSGVFLRKRYDTRQLQSSLKLTRRNWLPLRVILKDCENSALVL